MICKSILFSFLFLFSSLFLLCAKEFHTITIEGFPRIGMFAAANQVLGHLYLFETEQLPSVSGLTVDFGESGLYYDPSYGTNWWTYFFEPIYIGKNENAQLIYPMKNQYLKAWRYRRLISREVAAEMIKKYIHVKPHIQEKIDGFAMRFFQDIYMIGIHYRGTDKAKEAVRVEYATVFEEIKKHLPLEKPYRLFIATDEASFLEQARKKYSDRVISIDAHRSIEGSSGVHFMNKNNYSIGEEALIDACLLSKCDLLIRTSSNLSLWSTYFNPELPVILLNQRYMQTLEPE